MWPFRKRRRQLGFWVTTPLPGIRRAKDGGLEIELTDEEMGALREFQQMADEEAGEGGSALFHPEALPAVQSVALANYAHGQILLAKSEDDTVRSGDLLDKAVAALTKAYSLSGFPIYLCDLAHCMKLRGARGQARLLLNEFSEVQRKYRSSHIYESYLKERNLA